MKTCIMDKKTILYTKSNSTGLNNQQKTSRTFQLSISEVVLLQHLPIQHAKSSNKTDFYHNSVCLTCQSHFAWGCMMFKPFLNGFVYFVLAYHNVFTTPIPRCFHSCLCNTTSLPRRALWQREQWSKTLNLSNSYTCNSQQKVKPLLSSYYHLFQPLLTCLIGT